MVIRDLTLTD